MDCQLEKTNNIDSNIGYYSNEQWGKNFPLTEYKGDKGDTLLPEGFESKKEPLLSVNKNMIIPDKIKSDPFWLDQPKVLFNQLSEFYPDSQLSINEQLNAITRFVIYFGLILFIVSGHLSSLFLTIVGIVIVIFVSQHGRQFLSQRKEHFIANYRNLNQLPCDYPVEIAYDGTFYQPPTKENPFMNVLLSDYVSNPNRPPAGNLNDPEIKEEAEKLFRNNLFLDTNDIWEKRNNQRFFVTQPNTQIPNNQNEFAKWCFDTKNHSCRENYICKNDLAFDNSNFDFPPITLPPV